jgi:hypothetical protein
MCFKVKYKNNFTIFCYKMELVDPTKELSPGYIFLLKSFKKIIHKIK